MTLEQLVGKRYPLVTDYIEAFGGAEAVEPYIPFCRGEIKSALLSGDKHLNSLPSAAWVGAAGFTTDGMTYTPTGGGITKLYHKHGVDCFSPSQGVMILKEAARMLVKDW